MDLPLIVTSNHNSVIDVLVLLNLLPFRCVFFAKNSIFVIPGYGWYMWAAGHIPVQRTNPRSAYNSLDKGEAKLKEGTSIVIFPEGSRSENGELQCFKSGFARLAAKSGAPIIPVAISGTHKIINKGSMLLHPASVKVSIGKPVFTNKDNLVNNKQRSELTLQVQEETLNILKELQ
jgi:1-acyl-sn-glycerol-3-phosphate acyltransferase